MLKKSLFVRILTIASILLVNLRWGIVTASPVDTELQSAILYVKPGADGDCLSWATACELQTAIFNAVSGDQIWVAAGSYKPTTDTNRTAAFQLKSGVAIYGGFPAAGGDWSQRDWETYPATLSGDIGVSGDNADNSYHVVKSNGVGASAILDGFTISLGNANGSYPDNGGGGMYNNRSSPSLSNLTFSGNNAGGYGGGIYNDSSNPTLRNVTFSNNSATNDGGGMYNLQASPRLTNVTFSGNSATNDGGGMFNSQGNPALNNVTFSGNSAANDGGGMYNLQGSPSLNNITFSGNNAEHFGGGMLSFQSSPTLRNVTFSGNTATYNGGGIYNLQGSPTLTNAILWGNTPDQISGGSATATYSDIQGTSVYPGVGNINENPLLGSLADNAGSTQTHAIAAGSPAIDAGDPNVCSAEDQRGFFRPIDGDRDGFSICDMGAYEYGSTGPGKLVYLPLILK